MLQKSTANNEIPNDVLVEQIKTLSRYFNSQQNVVKCEDKSEKTKKEKGEQGEINILGIRIQKRSTVSLRGNSGSGSVQPSENKN